MVTPDRSESRRSSDHSSNTSAHAAASIVVAEMATEIIIPQEARATSPKKEKKKPSVTAFLGRTAMDLDHRGKQRLADTELRQKADRTFRIRGALTLPPCFTPPLPAHDHWNARPSEHTAAVLPTFLASRVPFEVRLQLQKLPPVPRRAATAGVGSTKGVVAVPLASMEEVSILRDGSTQWGQWLQGGLERGQKVVAPFPAGRVKSSTSNCTK